MKNKKKWLSFLTIATSLILCIISTFGITLAFFGGNASANLSTITLKTGIEIGAAIESSVGSAKVVPGQPVKITATGTVSATELGSADANNAVDGVVRAKFNVGNELGTVTISGNNTDFWTAGNDGYYYLVTAANGTTLRTVSKGTSVQIFGDLVVSKNFTNADSGKSVEASVIFEVIQADIYKADGTKETLTVANATTSGNAVNDAFKAIEAKATGSISITTNSEFFVGQSFATNNPELTYTDENGNARVISSYEVKSFDTTTLGEHTAVISYLGFDYNVNYTVVDNLEYFSNLVNNVWFQTPEEKIYRYDKSNALYNEFFYSVIGEDGTVYDITVYGSEDYLESWNLIDGTRYEHSGNEFENISRYYRLAKYNTQEEALGDLYKPYQYYIEMGNRAKDGLLQNIYESVEISYGEEIISINVSTINIPYNEEMTYYYKLNYKLHYNIKNELVFKINETVETFDANNNPNSISGEIYEFNVGTRDVPPIPQVEWTVVDPA